MGKCRLSLVRKMVALMATLATVLVSSFSMSGQMAVAAEVRAHVQSYQTLDSVIANWLKRPDLQNSMIGIEVMELPTGRILYSLNGNKRFVSASTCKVITTACAFDAFGANFKYSTKLFGSGTEAPKKVTGNLVLQPSQDPTLTRDDLRQMFVALAQKGLNQVDGSLYVGTVPGGFDSWTTGWLTEDWGQEWMPPSSNLAVDKNIAQGNAVLKSFKNINLGPDTAYNAASQALLLAGESAAWVECNISNNTLSFYRSPGMNLGAPLVVANPSAFNEALAATVASEVGVHFSNKAGKDKAFYSIVEHQSKPLSAIIQTCLYKSDNFYAQQILRTLGLAKTDATPDPITRDYRDQIQVQPSTLESRGLARVSAWLGKIGVPASEFVLFDGCGLSRKDGISPHTLNTVLKHMATPAVNGPYLQLLRRYSPVNKSDAWFAYKTGSMDTARSVSGVLETIGGQYCAVTIMVNGHRESVSALKGEIDSLVGILDTIKSIKFESAKPAATAAPAAPLRGSANKSATGGTATGAPGAAGTAKTAGVGGANGAAAGAGAGTPTAGGSANQASGTAQGSTPPGEVTLVEMAHGTSRAPRAATKSHRRRH